MAGVRHRAARAKRRDRDGGGVPAHERRDGHGGAHAEHTCGEQTGATSRRRLEASTPESDPTLPHWKRRCHDRAREDWYLGGRDASPKKGGAATAESDARGARRGGVVTPLEETCFPAEPRSAICVQRFDDSLNSAIRTTYRISLRSSSLREPRYPSAGVVCWLLKRTPDTDARTPRGDERRRASGLKGIPDASAAQKRARETTEDGKKEVRPRRKRRRRPAPPPRGGRRSDAASPEGSPRSRRARRDSETVRTVRCGKTGNDPSAGSPTETLLRLLLPLNDKVWTASRGIAAGEPAALPQSGGLTGSFNR
eukprot:CAMPEP_0119351916 /NCGR_PEP_ID=MMETSP1334-20130426/1184_1 /TAXON_ID=127549 /ORGANISM="Calcidiscus leptoporus, Strain RCC1130" /LENGTH=310 /DNA_ID=CAMNT_0007364829 /DNA_START=3318 /DNA_END=4251 /DNA_ORIENTATION=+